MKKGIRIWILAIILLVLGVCLVEAAITDKISSTKDTMKKSFTGIKDGFGDFKNNFKNPKFKYMFFAIGAITFWFLNKNDALGLGSIDKRMMIGLCVFVGYFMASWRLKTDGYEALGYILLVCFMLNVKNSNGESDKIWGADAGIMYMVGASVMAPWYSIAEGSPMNQAIMVHFAIGLLFPTLIGRWKKSRSENTEKGEGMFDWFNKKRKDKEEVDKVEDEKVDRYEDEIKHIETASQEQARKYEALEEKLAEITKNPMNMQSREQLNQQTQTQLAPFYAYPPMYMPGINPTAEADRINQAIEMMKEAIKREEKEFLKTPRGKTARYLVQIMKNVQISEGHYNYDYWNALFGENSNETQRFENEFSAICRNKEEITDMKKRLEKIKKNFNWGKGIVRPKEFIEDFAKPLITEYKKERDWAIKVLKESLEKLIHSGPHVVSSANHVTHVIEDVNKITIEDSKIIKSINDYMLKLKENAQKLANPELPLEEVDKIIKENVAYYKAAIELLQKRKDDGKELIGKSKEVGKVVKEYHENEEENSELTNVYLFQAATYALTEEEQHKFMGLLIGVSNEELQKAAENDSRKLQSEIEEMTKDEALTKEHFEKVTGKKVPDHNTGEFKNWTDSLPKYHEEGGKLIKVK